MKNLQRTLQVFVHIRDSNDHAPRFLKIDYSAQISEAQAMGSSVFKVSAVDDDINDNARITYELVSNEETGKC